MVARSSRHRPTAVALALAALLLGLVAQPAVAGRPLTPNIIGGEPTETGEYPFMAAILNDTIAGTDWNKQFCGGSLIAPGWVLTAAHCVDDAVADNLAVAVGRTHLASSEGQRVDVEAIHVHPNWHSPVFFAHDVALLELDRRVRQIAPITLAGPGDDGLEAPGTPLTVIGWGNTDTSGQPSYPDELREVVVPAVSDASCAKVYGSSFDGPTMVCAGEPGADSCQGDSGGPLFADRSGAPVQVGTVSFGVGCAKVHFPGVYGEVNNPSIRGWITAVSGV